MIIYILIGVNIILTLIALLAIKNKDTKPVQCFDEETFNALVRQIGTILEQTEKIIVTNIANSNESIRNELKNNINFQVEQLKAFSRQLEIMTNSNNFRLDNVTAVVDKNLSKLTADNERKLEEMRVTVDEKLNATLQTRLNQSFELISKNLDAVQSGLGEMRSLATGVGDLKKVLTNVKMRGTMAEVQLSTLLKQVLATSQFDEQVVIKPGVNYKDNRVDFVIKLPGKDNSEVYLPIDAKFPLEDYQRLVEVNDTNNEELKAKARKEFESTIKKEAQSIATKYIYPPLTTDFAIMYLALEGLYAEIIRTPGLMETLQEKYGILVCGPSTLCGLLNSLQLGFKTVAIEKRSSEIWALLRSFKKEFGTFVELLGKTQKQINTAGNTIEEATKRSQIVLKKLGTVDIDDGVKQTFIDYDTTNEDE